MNGSLRHVLFVLVAAMTGCAVPRPAPERAPTAVSLPAPWLTPVFHQESQMPPTGRLAERERCIDTEVGRRNLNAFGDPQGTTYREGAPVGVKSTSDRYRYIVQRNPGIATLCSRAMGEPDL